MKRALTLLELLVSLTLFGVILSFFFTTFLLHAKKKECVQLKKESVLEEKYFHQRLEKIFATASDAPSSIKDQWFFYTKEDSLYFTFDNGIFLPPQLSNYVHAAIWLEDRMIICSLYSLQDRDITYTFPLLDEIDDLSFSFFSNKILAWQDHWNQDDIPTFLKISYHRQQKNYEHLFDLKKTLEFKRER